MRFDHVGVFTYSHEDGTTAYAMTDDVPARVKRQRQAQLMRTQKRIVTRAQKARVGSRVRVLVDGPVRPITSSSSELDCKDRRRISTRSST
jgi:ribosomal protein S12 methylthiotransferase